MALRMMQGALVRVTTFNPDAPWRKHGTWREERSEKSTRAYDAISHRKVAPMGPAGLVIRRKAR